MIRSLFRFVFLSALLWCVGLVLFVFHINNLKKYDGKAEGVVVLTGGDGRVEAGLDLLDEGKADRLLVSGVHPDVKINELLAVNGHPASLQNKIDLGFFAQDTLGNADEASVWVLKNKIQSLIVVTAHYHMPRAMIHLGAQLPNVALYAYPVTPKMFANKDWIKDATARRLLIKDYNKFLLTYPQILLLRYSN